MTYKIDACQFLARCSALLAQCQDNVMSGHGADGLVSQWDSTIKSP